jgi:propionate CoA-transferase
LKHLLAQDELKLYVTEAILRLVAAEENITDLIITILESGPWIGLVVSGNEFGLVTSSFAL